MLPILVSIGPVKIYAYGFCLFVSLFLGLFLWWRMGKDENLDEIKLFDAFFLSLVWFLIGARLANWWWGTGRNLVWWQNLALLSYPGLIDWFGVGLALMALVIYVRKQEWQVMKVLDMAVVTLSFIMMGVNFGGFLNGANPGKNLGILGVHYPGVVGKVFPVDLWGVVVFGLGWWLVAKVRREFRFYEWYKGKRGVAKDGLAVGVFGIVVGVYYLGRYWLDNFDWWWVGVGFILISLVEIYYLSGKKLEWDYKKAKLINWRKVEKRITKRLKRLKRKK